MEEVNKALIRVKTAREELLGSRAWALQALDNLNTLVQQTELLLIETANVDVMAAALHFKNARQKVEDYSNRISFMVQELDKRIALIEFARRDQELDVSGIELKAGVDLLLNYRQIL